MIGDDVELVLRALEVVSPLVKSSNDCQQLLVVDLVVALRIVQRLRVECHRV